MCSALNRIVAVLFLLIACSSSVVNAADLNSELYQAVLVQDVGEINKLIAAGANPNHLENGRPLLGWAAQNGNVEVVKALIDAKGDVNVADVGIGHTPLMRAIETQQSAIVQVLLKAGANPNAKASDGETCLEMAVQSRKPEIVSALVAAGVDVKYVSPEGDSAALAAAQNGMEGSVEIIRILGKAKSNMDASNAAYTPLSYAVEQGNVELVKALLESGANPNALTASGRAPLFIAADNKEITELLLTAKADPNMLLHGGMSALTNAIESGTPEAVEALIKAGADVNKLDGNGSSPLQVANNYSKAEIVEVLKKHGATQ